MTNEELTEKFDAIKKETLDLVEAWNKERPDGWSGMYRFLFNLVGDLVDVVEASQAVVTGPQKKETVIAAVKYAYKEVNPDLPWIPEPVETRIEEWLIDNAAPALIDWLVKTYNDKGIFKHGE